MNSNISSFDVKVEQHQFEKNYRKEEKKIQVLMEE